MLYFRFFRAIFTVFRAKVRGNEGGRPASFFIICQKTRQKIALWWNPKTLFIRHITTNLSNENAVSHLQSRSFTLSSLQFAMFFRACFHVVLGFSNGRMGLWISHFMTDGHKSGRKTGRMGASVCPGHKRPSGQSFTGFLAPLLQEGGKGVGISLFCTPHTVPFTWERGVRGRPEALRDITENIQQASEGKLTDHLTKFVKNRFFNWNQENLHDLPTYA